MTRDIHNLAGLIRTKREQAAMSAAELARRAKVTTGTITRLELGQIPHPKPATLKSIALALGLPVSDLLASADYLDPGDLPTLTPYLRTKYGHLSDNAQREIAAAFRDIAARHGYNPDTTGPDPHEDEH